MNRSDFQNSLQNPSPPEGAEGQILGLWHAHRGNWEDAHEMAQNSGHALADWFHAWLHRKEGDHSNADYWYAKAGRKRPTSSLEEELEEITRQCLPV